MKLYQYMISIWVPYAEFKQGWWVVFVFIYFDYRLNISYLDSVQTKCEIVRWFRYLLYFSKSSNRIFLPRYKFHAFIYLRFIWHLRYFALFLILNTYTEESKTTKWCWCRGTNPVRTTAQFCILQSFSPFSYLSQND